MRPLPAEQGDLAGALGAQVSNTSRPGSVAPLVAARKPTPRCRLRRIVRRPARKASHPARRSVATRRHVAASAAAPRRARRPPPPRAAAAGRARSARPTSSDPTRAGCGPARPARRSPPGRSARRARRARRGSGSRAGRRDRHRSPPIPPRGPVVSCEVWPRSNKLKLNKRLIWPTLTKPPSRAKDAQPWRRKPAPLGAGAISNRERVVEALRVLGVTSRAEVARRTGLSRSTVSSIVAALQAEGPWSTARTTAGRRRRRPPARDDRARSDRRLRARASTSASATWLWRSRTSPTMCSPRSGT